MKREIKFRAWDVEAEEMREVEILGLSARDSFSWSHGRGYLHNCQEWGGEDGYIRNPVLMQYTGLKDKNGVEIYEGDVLATTFRHDGTRHHMEVSWLPETHGWGLRISEVTTVRIKTRVYEVIGNIYENPELLTDSNVTPLAEPE